MSSNLLSFFRDSCSEYEQKTNIPLSQILNQKVRLDNSVSFRKLADPTITKGCEVMNGVARQSTMNQKAGPVWLRAERLCQSTNLSAPPSVQPLLLGSLMFLQAENFHSSLEAVSQCAHTHTQVKERFI